MSGWRIIVCCTCGGFRLAQIPCLACDLPSDIVRRLAPDQCVCAETERDVRMAVEP